MRTFTSWEDMAQANVALDSAPVLEAFSGSSIVRWYQTIRFGLREKIARQEGNRNDEYAALLRTYSNLWDANPITGSMNVETVKLLKAAAEPYATMDWNEQKYYEGLVTSLDELLADQEQLPGNVDTEQNMPLAGGAGGSMPPMGTDFGPEENPPGGMPGGPGGPGGEEAAAGGPGGEEAAAGGPLPMPGAEVPGGLPGEPGQPEQPGQPGQPPPLPGELPGQPPRRRRRPVPPV